MDTYKNAGSSALIRGMFLVTALSADARLVSVHVPLNVSSRPEGLCLVMVGFVRSAVQWSRERSHAATSLKSLTSLGECGANERRGSKPLNRQ